MHELGLSEGIVQATLRRADGRPVRSVRVRIGGHPVDPEVIEQAFRLAAVGTVAEDASVEIVMIPMAVHCRGCGDESPVTDHLDMVMCPRCGGLDIEVTSDDQAVLESITLQPAQPVRQGGSDGRD